MEDVKEAGTKEERFRAQFAEHATREFRRAFFESGLKQATAAAVMGVSLATLNAYLAGKYQPRVDVYMAMLALAEEIKTGERR